MIWRGCPLVEPDSEDSRGSAAPSGGIRCTTGRSVCHQVLEVQRAFRPHPVAKFRPPGGRALPVDLLDLPRGAQSSASMMHRGCGTTVTPE